MKSITVLLLAAGLSSQAALVQFALSPAGTDAAVGLSPANEVPVVTNSTGSGDVISGGIVFDVDQNLLHLAIGYGSAAGFTDLTGPATVMHIHGPAAPGQPAGVLIDLAPYHFPAADPARGGVIVGTAPVPLAMVSNLLAGFTYVNVHTASNPPGEIRGQLIALVVTNAPPTVSCGEPVTLECGSPTQVTVLVSDPEGDALTVIWSLDGAGFQTNTVPGGTPGAVVPVSASPALALGTNVVSVLVVDAATNTASCATIVTVVDTTPPVITAAVANPNSLWPPNHRLVPINLRVSATDGCSATTWRIVRVTSNEPVNGLGDGDTAPDWQIIGDHGVKLRAERSGRGNGRIYTIVVQATDASGNVSEPRRVTVTVPKSQGHGR